MSEALLKVENLTKHFDIGQNILLWKKTRLLKAVDGISFSVAANQSLGIVGESGCGKSTTARLISALIPASSGKVEFQGKNIFTLPKNERKMLCKDIQIVFQDPFSSLNPRMRIVEIVGRPMRWHFGLRASETVDRVVALLEQVGLRPEHLYRYPHEFSGGQRQRIAIARALSTEPRLLIADEAVSALDVSVQAQIIKLLQKLQREHNLAMVFIAHDLNVVEYCCDVVAVMYCGKIVEMGPVEELYKEPLHPYTKTLLAASPKPDPDASLPPPIAGEPATPVNPPPGCRFEPRCPNRLPECIRSEPSRTEHGKEHWVACHMMAG